MKHDSSSIEEKSRRLKSRQRSNGDINEDAHERYRKSRNPDGNSAKCSVVLQPARANRRDTEEKPHRRKSYALRSNSTDSSGSGRSVSRSGGDGQKRKRDAERPSFETPPARSLERQKARSVNLVSRIVCVPCATIGANAGTVETVRMIYTENVMIQARVSVGIGVMRDLFSIQKPLMTSILVDRIV